MVEVWIFEIEAVAESRMAAEAVCQMHLFQHGAHRRMQPVDGFAIRGSGRRAYWRNFLCEVPLRQRIDLRRNGIGGLGMV